MSLFRYKAKRDFKSSPEPLPKKRKKKGKELIFVIQEHHARRLHYDLRLEVDGVLKSWAVPKQPSLDPATKRLAIMVEDHPYSYKDFEGVIPFGYGKGTVKIWDHGTYSSGNSEQAVKAGLKKGHLTFNLQGKKLKGNFHLVKLKNAKKNEWLLFKGHDDNHEQDVETNLFKNLDKVFWPAEKYTKGDLMQYYLKVAPWILPYLKDRPESLRRYPDGIKGLTFFQKNLTSHPDWIETTSITHEKKEVEYLLIQDEKSLAFAVNLGCIEIHPFFSRVQKLHKPDFVIWDLDPKGASFAKVIEVAKGLHELLEEIGVHSYCKTSGATGLHIAVPLGAKYSYEEAKKFAVLIGEMIRHRLPKIATLERSISKRNGKVYVDCYQNNFGQTLAAPYSVRAKPGAPVSTPLKWSEVKKGLDPKKFTIKTALKRFKRVGDLYEPVLGKGINLLIALKNLALIKDHE